MQAHDERSLRPRTRLNADTVTTVEQRRAGERDGRHARAATRDPGQKGEPFVSGDFLVAAYQRGYRWGREEVRRCSRTSRPTHEAAEAPDRIPNDYYLQPVVVLDRDDGSWELVDGQQRLTTLYLIVKYIQHEASRTPRSSTRLTYETREDSRDVP